MKSLLSFILLALVFQLASCQENANLEVNKAKPDTSSVETYEEENSEPKGWINPEGKTVQTRIFIPEGFERKEVKRLQALSQSGAVAGKLLLERKYEIEKLDAMLLAFREALLLHGLNQSQIENIEKKRNLLREVTISVPYIHADSSLHDEGEEVSRHFREKYQQRQFPQSPREIRQADKNNNKFTRIRGSQELALLDGPGQSHSGHSHSNTSGNGDAPHFLTGSFTLREINVHKGASVSAGDTLCVLTNYSQLYLEGHAYEQDMPALLAAVQNNLDLKAEFHTSSTQAEVVEGLKIRYLSNEVNAQTRTYHFYIEMQNELISEENSSETPASIHKKFLNWKYKPGQRAYVNVPVKIWEQRLVAPRDAVVQEGPNAYVFKKEGSQYRRIPIHVLYHDRENVVIAEGKELKANEVIAMRGAQQMHMALERSGSSQGGGHSHAGHSHSH